MSQNAGLKKHKPILPISSISMRLTDSTHIESLQIVPSNKFWLEALQKRRRLVSHPESHRGSAPHSPLSRLIGGVKCEIFVDLRRVGVKPGKNKTDGAANTSETHTQDI